MNVLLRPETHEDWPWLWHWRHELIDPDWKRWDSPFLHAQTRRVSYEGFVRGRAINNRTGGIIDLDGRPVGFVECSRIPQARMWRGQRYDSIQMALLRSDWEADRREL